MWLGKEFLWLGFFGWGGLDLDSGCGWIGEADGFFFSVFSFSLLFLMLAFGFYRRRKRREKRFGRYFVQRSVLGVK